MKERRNLGVAYVLWYFLGIMGGHKFYLEKIGVGLLYFFTLGFFGIGWLIDLFTLPAQVRAFNNKHFSDSNTYNNSHHSTPITNPTDIEKIILQVAQKKKGLITPMDIAVDTPVSLDNAKIELEKMVQKGYADMEVSETGIIVYRLLNFSHSTSDINDAQTYSAKRSSTI